MCYIYENNLWDSIGTRQKYFLGIFKTDIYIFQLKSISIAFPMII